MPNSKFDVSKETFQNIRWKKHCSKMISIENKRVFLRFFLYVVNDSYAVLLQSLYIFHELLNSSKRIEIRNRFYDQQTLQCIRNEFASTKVNKCNKVTEKENHILISLKKIWQYIGKISREKNKERLVFGKLIALSLTLSEKKIRGR